MRGLLSFGALVALAAPSAAQQPRVSPDALRGAMLSVHNAARAEVRAAPLAWSEPLAAEARAYAGQLARTGRMEHSGRRGQGENLWSGTRGVFSSARMAQYWIDEKRFFINRPAVQFSTSGNWTDVGHYTQAIWSTTTQIGCGIATGRQLDFLVCRYTPPGNVIGQTAVPVR